MASKVYKQLGINPPISEAPPTARDVQLDGDLRRTLNSLGVFESAAQRAQRDDVLAAVRKVVKRWAVGLAAERGLPPLPTEGEGVEATHGGYGAQIVTFGSYHLQVHAPDADMDLLCVAPKHVSRADLFDPARSQTNASLLVFVLFLFKFPFFVPF